MLTYLRNQTRQRPLRAPAVCEKCKNLPAEHVGTLTSQPFGVVLDGTQNGAALPQTSVNHRIARQEVRHGGRVEITTWDDKEK